MKRQSGFHHLPQAHQCPASLQASAALEDTLLLPTPSSAIPVLLLSMRLKHMEYPFGQVGSVILTVSPPSLFLNPSLLAEGW